MINFTVTMFVVYVAIVNALYPGLKTFWAITVPIFCGFILIDNLVHGFVAIRKFLLNKQANMSLKSN